MTTLTETRMTSAELAAEVEHLLAYRIWPERIATQLGYSLTTLNRRMSRHGRYDLANQLRINPLPRDCRADGMGGPCRQPPLIGRNICRSHAKQENR